MTQRVIFNTEARQNKPTTITRKKIFSRRKLTMATAKQATKARPKRTGKKVKPRFHTVRSLQKTKDNWIETVKEYNEKYIIKPFEKSKDFVTGMQKDPAKTVGNIYHSGKDFVEDIRKDPKKAWNSLLESGKDLAGGTREDFLKIVDNVMDGSKSFYAGVEKDTQKMVDDFLDRGKEITRRIPGKDVLEKEINRRLESVPDRLNLPSKKEMEKLSKTVRTLNTKLNALGKQCAA